MVRQPKKDDYVQLGMNGTPLAEQARESIAKRKIAERMPSFTKEELKQELERIRHLGWISIEEMGDGSHGRTLERLLGVPENNLSIPDLGKFELKSSLSDADTPVTLFSKVPTRVGKVSLSRFILDHGYWDAKRNRQSLYCTVSAKKVNSLGWLMQVDSVRGRIHFKHHGHTVAYQDTSALKDILSRKISNLVLVVADRTKLDQVQRFRYSKAYLLADVDLLLFLLKIGAITFDWRMHIKANGSPRDHGPAYRMMEKKLPLLYGARERLF